MTRINSIWLSISKAQPYYLIVIVLLTAGFLLRFYAAGAVPLVEDEQWKVELAKEVSFDLKNPNLPVSHPYGKNPILSVYVLKFSSSILGGSRTGRRFLFVVLGALSLYFIFRLTKEELGRQQGLFALALLTFSQFHIGSCRLIDEDCLLLFFSALALWAFFKALRSREKKWVYFTAAVIGIGYYGKMLIVLLLPVFFIFILSKKKYRFWLKSKEIYYALLLVFILILPHILWSITSNFDNFYNAIFKLNPGLRAFYMYFAEAFAWLAGPGFKAAMGPSNEFAVAHWVLGIAIFAGLFYSFKKNNRKEELAGFSLIMFIFIFLVASFVGQSVSSCDNHYWATLTFYPGVILCSNMLIRLREKYKFMNFIIFALVTYLAVYSFYFISLPESIFAVPKVIR